MAPGVLACFDGRMMGLWWRGVDLDRAPYAHRRRGHVQLDRRTGLSRGRDSSRARKALRMSEFRLEHRRRLLATSTEWPELACDAAVCATFQPDG